MSSLPPAMIQAPACPRCGYDQSGIVATWNDRCPLKGVCSECGLPFDWHDLLDPDATTPSWSFEHARSRPFRKLQATWVRSLRPWTFWRSMRLEHPIIPRRIFVWMFACLAALHALAAAKGLAEEWEDLYRDIVGWVASQRRLHFDGPALARSLGWPYSFAPTPPGARWGLVVLWAILIPIAYLVLQDTLRTAKVRPAHLWRALAYFLGAVPLLLGLDLLVYFVADGPLEKLARPWIETLAESVYRKNAWILVAAAGAWNMLASVAFTRSYLQLARPRRVAFTLTAVAFLGAVAIVTYWPGSRFLRGVVFWFE